MNSTDGKTAHDKKFTNEHADNTRGAETDEACP